MKKISKTLEQEALTPSPVSIESCRELEIPKIVVVFRSQEEFKEMGIRPDVPNHPVIANYMGQGIYVYNLDTAETNTLWDYTIKEVYKLDDARVLFPELFL
jgi:hypothetical protein